MAKIMSDEDLPMFFGAPFEVLIDQDEDGLDAGEAVSRLGGEDFTRFEVGRFGLSMCRVMRAGRPLLSTMLDGVRYVSARFRSRTGGHVRSVTWRVGAMVQTVDSDALSRGPVIEGVTFRAAELLRVEDSSKLTTNPNGGG